MPRLFAATLMVALSLAPHIARAQDENLDRPNPPRTQQDIGRERTNACRGLKGQALTECLANYVGSERRAGAGAWKRPAHPARTPGRA
jgi:hypothetical protein